tara:strand:+ start:112 stop:1095 length:984 start_codon:yes stop_codon:yes gene_type:complete
MITLDQLTDNIHGIMYPNTLTLEGEIPKSQVKMWIHYHRAKLIADNIDKGILAYDNITQNIRINTRSLKVDDVISYHKNWDKYEDNLLPSAPVISTTGYLSKLPLYPSGKLTNDFIAMSSLSNGGATINLDHDLYARNKSQYGDEITRTQLKGDFRNIGFAEFKIPKLLMLNKNQAVKNFSISRRLHKAIGDSSHYNNQYAPVSLYYKTQDDEAFGNYNKFTRNDKSYYVLDKLTNYQDYVRIGGLQVSPNYHGGLHSYSAEESYWAYRGEMQAILADPTSIKDFERNSSWSDDTSPYPIPSEYVSELIQRIIQQETSMSLQIMANE